jgi:hypothetical protein
VTSKKGKNLLFPSPSLKSKVKELSSGHQFLRGISKDNLYKKPLYRKSRVKVPKYLWRGTMKSL